MTSTDTVDVASTEEASSKAASDRASAADAERAPDASTPDRRAEVVFECREVGVAYSGTTAIEDVTLDIPAGEITALIGPSGCGKSTLLRCFNRMNDLVPGAAVGGTIKYHDVDLYGDKVDPVEVRRHIGMVFQKPNPFPKSIYDNIAYGLRIQGRKRNDLDEAVEQSLVRAALWEEVKDRLRDSAYGLSGGQQQRLCIARAIATSPDVILMDEPCSALDPIATSLIEELMEELKGDYTILIVTHNMQQAARVSDKTAFITTDVHEGGRIGHLVEFDHTERLFTNPTDERTEGYITGRFG